MQELQFGQTRIHRIVESVCADFEPLSFFPETTPDHWEPHLGWMQSQPQAMDPASGNIVLTIPSPTQSVRRASRSTDDAYCVWQRVHRLTRLKGLDWQRTSRQWTAARVY